MSTLSFLLLVQVPVLIRAKGSDAILTSSPHPLPGAILLSLRATKVFPELVTTVKTAPSPNGVS
jgi:hypothetical protein